MAKTKLAYSVKPLPWHILASLKLSSISVRKTTLIGKQPKNMCYQKLRKDNVENDMTAAAGFYHDTYSRS